MGGPENSPYSLNALVPAVHISIASSLICVSIQVPRVRAPAPIHVDAIVVRSFFRAKNTVCACSWNRVH